MAEQLTKNIVVDIGTKRAIVTLTEQEKPYMERGKMLEQMLIMMVNAHSGQFDRGGRPYALHPLKVMHYLRSEDEELQCIALGHDIIEDTSVTYRDLVEAGMTGRVVEGIRALTKQPGETLEEYKARVFANSDAMLVKQADLRHNSDIRRLKGVTQRDIERTARYHEFYVEICQKLGNTK
jgi:(p)ppGpp synthase/HD superfamily hydrolase